MSGTATASSAAFASASSAFTAARLATSASPARSGISAETLLVRVRLRVRVRIRVRVRVTVRARVRVRVRVRVNPDLCRCCRSASSRASSEVVRWLSPLCRASSEHEGGVWSRLVAVVGRRSGGLEDDGGERGAGGVEGGSEGWEPG